jgi:hypothetical protein
MGRIQHEVFEPIVDGGPVQTSVHPFNKVGKPYPQHWDGNSNRMVWFPEPPYNPARTANYPQFNTNCQNFYRQNRWTWMTWFASNHHVKPVRWGGGDEGSNCFRLRNWDHDKFTDWWGSGNTKFETPVSH